jgi:hypothetical protein
MCPDLWPSLGASTTNLDIYLRVLVLLEGEQNKILPCVGSEQHAAPYTPHAFPFLPQPNTCTHSIAPGKGDTPMQHATKLHLEALKPSSLYEDSPDKAGEVGFRPIHLARKAGVETLKCVVIEAIEPEGVLLDANTTLAPTKGTASVKLAGRAVEATTCKHDECRACVHRREGEIGEEVWESKGLS